MQFERERQQLFARHDFDSEGRRIVDRGGRMTYVLMRDKGQIPTILIHGGLSNAAEWVLTAGSLPGHVVIPDRPGCGLSDPVDYLGTDYRAEAVSWMEGLVDALSAERVNLVANSMGGYFSIAFALAHPERVRRMVLVGAPAGLHRHVPIFIRLWGTPGIGRLISDHPPDDPERIRKDIYGKLLVARPEELSTEFLQLVGDSLRLPGAGWASYTMLRAVLDRRGWRPRLRLDEEMATLFTPTMFIWGDADAFAPPSVGGGIVARMPEACLEVVERTGHLPHMDTPGRVARLTTAFLTRGTSD